MKQDKDSSSFEEKLLGEDSGRRRFTIDRLLEKWAGEFGRWQLKHFILVSFAWTLEAMHTMVMIFADHEPDWRCKSNYDLLGFESCSPAASICYMDRSLWEWTSGSGVSTVSEWGLLCAEKYKVGLAQSAFFVGCLIGAGIFGHLSDSSLGRKGVLILVCIMNAVFGLMTAMSPNFWIYTLLRLLTGISTGGMGLSSFVLATEPVGPSKRGPVGMSAFYFFSLGITILPLLSYFFTTWRLLYVASSIPSLVYVLLVLPFVSESPRWYLVKGRTEEAMEVMRSIASHNGNILPASVSLALEEEEEDEESDVDPREPVKGSPVDIFRCPVTRTRMAIMLLIWFSGATVYYGLSLNVVNLHASLHVSVLLNGICEMPAFAITAVLLQKVGRRAMLVSTMLLSGFFAVAGSIITASASATAAGTKGSVGVLQMGCSILGIFGMAGTYNLMYIYTAELFPTVVRNAALGMASVTGNLGAIFAPLVIVLATVNPGLPFGVIGLCGLVGGVVAMKLPETLNQPLYETMSALESGETRGNC